MKLSGYIRCGSEISNAMLLPSCYYAGMVSVPCCVYAIAVFLSFPAVVALEVSVETLITQC